jgi:hypothetical protein
MNYFPTLTKTIAIFMFYGLGNSQIQAQSPNNSLNDSIAFTKYIAWAHTNQLQKLPNSEALVAIGKYFLGTPYVGGTLDKNEQEQLVVNLRELDCVTYVENVLALHWCLFNKPNSYEGFKQILQQIRYRDGKINGYASRLHYFSDWLSDNTKYGSITIPSEDFATDSLDMFVNILSKNATRNKHLHHKAQLEKIKQQEKNITSKKLKYIPKNKLPDYETYIKDGDILAITSSISGLDIAHTGFAVWVKGELHLLHASSNQKKVTVSKNTLYDYLKSNSRFTGIVVGREKQ